MAAGCRARARRCRRCPGVGRKTANVVLNVAFGEPTMAVDTHVFRVANRTGLAPGKDPLQVELGLLERVPAAYLADAHHWLILHGRYVCQARTAAVPAVPGRGVVRLRAEDAVSVNTMVSVMSRRRHGDATPLRGYRWRCACCRRLAARRRPGSASPTTAATRSACHRPAQRVVALGAAPDRARLRGRRRRAARRRDPLQRLSRRRRARCRSSATPSRSIWSASPSSGPTSCWSGTRASAQRQREQLRALSCRSTRARSAASTTSPRTLHAPGHAARHARRRRRRRDRTAAALDDVAGALRRARAGARVLPALAPAADDDQRRAPDRAGHHRLRRRQRRSPGCRR